MRVASARSRVFVAAMAAFLLAPSSWGAGADPAPPMSEEEQRIAASVLELGTLIFLHDRAAWIGTDEVRKLKSFDKDKRLRGYITERRGNEIRVTFYGAEKGEADAALYRVVVPESGAPHLAEKMSEPEPLSAYEAGAVAARGLALSERFEPACSRQHNTVVIPAPVGAESGWAVYILPGTTDAKVLPVGGAHRVEVNAAGDRIINRRAYSRSCLNLTNEPKAVALVLSHLLDPQPTELHVFWSLQTRKPLAVVTVPAGSMWFVSGREGIKLMERGKETDRQ
jgi:hypothetical protein